MRHHQDMRTKHGFWLPVVALLLCSLSACSSTTSRSGKSGGEKVVVEREYPVYPDGVVDYVWEEPTREMVDIPPGLDPEGHYYRPGHQEVVETLPGRYRFYEE